MNFIDDALIEKQLYPFTLTRSAADIRIGIRTIREKWAVAAGLPDTLAVPAHLLPTEKIFHHIRSGGDAFAVPDALYICHPWHIFQYNDVAIRQDYAWITASKTSQPLPASNTVTAPENVFLEPGAKVEHCSLNAATGPIYIGNHAEIMEGSLIRGPFALGEGAVVKMGARIYGATTIGPYCVAGGEIKNSVFFGYSNKAHDGYLGDSVIGEWCNLGAGTSNSNLKNNAGDVKVRNRPGAEPVNAGLKCGLLLGDYSRSAINTSFNTGTVAGVCCNIFGPDLTPAYIHNFSWGNGLFSRYDFDKAIRDIGNWKKLKHQSLTTEEIRQLKHIFDNH